MPAGMNRHFGRGNVAVKVNGKDAPTVGNICMDACMIDVTGIDCEVGGAVEIFGQQAARAKACRHARHNPLRDSHLGFPKSEEGVLSGMRALQIIMNSMTRGISSPLHQW